MAQAAGAGGLYCNVWVYCGDSEVCGDNYRHCWLKHQKHPAAPAYVSLGP